MSGRRLPRPVLKWAGGKRQLLPQIVQYLPEQIDTYFEPFVGGAAVFFELAAEGRFRKAIISDRNPDVVAVYRALQEDVEGLIRLLKRFRHSEEDYYRHREQNPRGLLQRAARVIYLNRTGYNGLYRVNRSGKFNVPFGRHKNPRICDEENLRAAAAALKNTEVRQEDFESVCALAKPGDAVYFDPPYLPVSRTANFAAYDPHPFGLDEHERLQRAFAQLQERCVAAVLSNSDTADTRRLFGRFEHLVVSVTRPINSKAERRGAISELLVYSRA